MGVASQGAGSKEKAGRAGKGETGVRGGPEGAGPVSSLPAEAAGRGGAGLHVRLLCPPPSVVLGPGTELSPSDPELRNRGALLLRPRRLPALRPCVRSPPRA